MRLVNDGDEQLFHTVTVAVRLGRSDRIIQNLMAGYDEDWDDPEAGFRYALALIATLLAGGSEFEKRDSYTQSLEALDDVIGGVPEHWLARYCRARHRVLVRTGYGRYQEYLNDDRGKAAEDLDELLRCQEQVPWQPYFTAAYMLAAQFHAGQGDSTRAADLIGEAHERPRAPVPFPALGTIMSEPFLTLCYSANRRPAKTVGAMMAELFPDTPAVRSALRSGVVG